MEGWGVKDRIGRAVVRKEWAQVFVLGVRGKGKVSGIGLGKEGKRGWFRGGGEGARGRPSSPRRRTVNAGAFFLLCACW